MVETADPRRWALGRGRAARPLATGCVALLSVFVFASATARAGDEALPIATSYGMGVHAFHAGDYQRSYDDLTNAIEAGSQDARAFYFRGLAALRLGRCDEAEADFAEGASREADGRATLPIARSLERVQGPDRLKLERYRARARVAALQRSREAEALRYSRIREAAPGVLRTRRPESIRPDDAVAPALRDGSAVPPPEEIPPGRPAEAPADRSDPFGDEPRPTGDAKADQVDERMEVEAAEVDDAADQKAEREESFGGGEPQAEEVKDDST